jgi:hypothetical protein
MLDFFVILGRIPGTNIEITFSQLLAVFFILSIRYEYKLHRRWLKWLWYRTCVNYRKQKRHMRAVVRYKRYRLAVFERKIKRNIRFALKRRQRAVYMFFYRRYSLSRRYYYRKIIEIERLERRFRRSRAISFWHDRIAI